jgi:RNA polymerase sigma factor (sigma-70 family)
MEVDATAPVPLPQQGRTGPERVGSTDVTAGTGDRGAAVSALYAGNALGLVRLAYIMLGNRQAAEDVVQEAFIGLYRRWSLLDEQAKALGYVRSSVLNGCRSQLRRSPTVELDGSDGPSVTSAESAVLTAEERREVIRALRCLPARQREVLARGATWRLNRSGRRWQPAARGVKWFQLNITEQYRQLGIAIADDVAGNSHNRRGVTFAPIGRESENVADPEDAHGCASPYAGGRQYLGIAEQDFSVRPHHIVSGRAAEKLIPKAVRPGEKEGPLTAQK